MLLEPVYTYSEAGDGQYYCDTGISGQSISWIYFFQSDLANGTGAVK